MTFRPCIDIHNGTVKQIVGGSLQDMKNQAETNFESELGADFYARLYQRDHITGGHVILLNASSSPYYDATKEQGLKALKAYPGGLQIGGGITAENAQEYIDFGASHVIVTSYVFQEGRISWENLNTLVKKVGKQHLVLDLSCRKKPGTSDYYIVTNRWQNYTDEKLNLELLSRLADSCDEFLVHGVDVEGKSQGVEFPLVELLTQYDGIPVTYAGGIGTVEMLNAFRNTTGDRLNYTIGSGLDLFGGPIAYESIIRDSKCEQFTD